MMGLAPNKTSNLADVVERILDKGLVINADIAVSIAGTELLGIKIRATLASFETAAKYGEEQVLIWRRSYDVPPMPLDWNSLQEQTSTHQAGRRHP